MHSKVSDLLEKINSLSNQTSLRKISKLEFDLLMQHLRDLYEELDLLRSQKKKEKEIQEQETDVVPIPETLLLKKLKSSKKNILLNPIFEKNESIIVTTKEEPVEIKAQVKVESVTKSSINEIIKSPESLNSKLKQISSKEVHHKLSTKPLKELIDLNKRFTMVNELFKGNADAFAQAINRIDSSEDFISAESFIQSQLFTKYQWDESSQTVKLFLKLVDQKFGVE